MKNDVASPLDSNRPLSPKAQHFVAEYLKDLNATKAAIHAGYSRHTAKFEGPRLLTNTNIRQTIDLAAIRAGYSRDGANIRGPAYYQIPSSAWLLPRPARNFPAAMEVLAPLPRPLLGQGGELGRGV